MLYCNSLHWSPGVFLQLCTGIYNSNPQVAGNCTYVAEYGNKRLHIWPKYIGTSGTSVPFTYQETCMSHTRMIKVPGRTTSDLLTNPCGKPIRNYKMDRNDRSGAQGITYRYNVHTIFGFFDTPLCSERIFYLF